MPHSPPPAGTPVTLPVMARQPTRAEFPVVTKLGAVRQLINDVEQNVSRLQQEKQDLQTRLDQYEEKFREMDTKTKKQGKELAQSRHMQMTTKQKLEQQTSVVAKAQKEKKQAEDKLSLADAKIRDMEQVNQEMIQLRQELEEKLKQQTSRESQIRIEKEQAEEKLQLANNGIRDTERLERERMVKLRQELEKLQQHLPRKADWDMERVDQEMVKLGQELAHQVQEQQSLIVTMAAEKKQSEEKLAVAEAKIRDMGKRMEQVRETKEKQIAAAMQTLADYDLVAVVSDGIPDPVSQPYVSPMNSPVSEASESASTSGSPEHRQSGSGEQSAAKRRKTRHRHESDASATLSDDEDRVHSIASDWYQCKLCNYSQDKASVIQQHMVDKHECKTCDKHGCASSFTEEQSLLLHVQKEHEK